MKGKEAILSENDGNPRQPTIPRKETKPQDQAQMEE